MKSAYYTHMLNNYYVFSEMTSKDIFLKVGRWQEDLQLLYHLDVEDENFEKTLNKVRYRFLHSLIEVLEIAILEASTGKKADFQSQLRNAENEKEDLKTGGIVEAYKKYYCKGKGSSSGSYRDQSYEDEYSDAQTRAPEGKSNVEKLKRSYITYMENSLGYCKTKRWKVPKSWTERLEKLQTCDGDEEKLISIMTPFVSAFTITLRQEKRESDVSKDANNFLSALNSYKKGGSSPLPFAPSFPKKR